MDELLEYHKERIQKIIKLYKMNNYELSKLTKVNQNSIDAYRYSRRIPKIKTAIAIATTFGISLDWLYGFTDMPYTEESIRIAENESYMKFQTTIPYKPGIQYSLEARANLIILQQYSNVIKDNTRKTNKMKIINQNIQEIAESGIPKYIIT